MSPEEFRTAGRRLVDDIASLRTDVDAVPGIVVRHGLDVDRTLRPLSLAAPTG